MGVLEIPLHLWNHFTEPNAQPNGNGGIAKQLAWAHKKAPAQTTTAIAYKLNDDIRSGFSAVHARR